MAIIVRVPVLGNDDNEVVVGQWLRTVGQQVSAGQPLVALETSKSVVEIEAPADGWLLRCFAGEGEELTAHSALAAIGAQGEQLAEQEGAPEVSTPPDLGKSEKPPDRQLIVPRAAVPASPRARLLANRYDIDLGELAGTGPRGLILIADVVRARKLKAEQPPTRPSPGDGPDRAARKTVPLTRMRSLIARRLVSSLSESAQFTVHRRADAQLMLEVHRKLRAAELPQLPRVTLNDLILFAVSRTLPRFPQINAHFSWDGISQFEHVDLGFAVDTPRGLVVPYIPAADTLSLAEVSDSASRLAAAAKDNTLGPDQTGFASFTVTNLGGAGVDYFTPILDPPQVAILGVGAIQETSGAAQLPLSLTVDHRAVDGVAAAVLLAALTEALSAINVLLAV